MKARLSACELASGAEYSRDCVNAQQGALIFASTGNSAGDPYK
jgi:hypothetical protein